MQVRDILSIERICCDKEDLHSKKAVLEHLGEILARDCVDLTSLEIFSGLLARERLGSTGLGNGISIPHARMAGINRTKGAFVRLSEGVDYDAVDNLPVDMFFALLVPEDSTDEHLQILAQLAEMFSNEDFLQRLREQSEAEKILSLIANA